jgi:hypothetical protein
MTFSELPRLEEVFTAFCDSYFVLTLLKPDLEYKFDFNRL